MENPDMAKAKKTEPRTEQNAAPAAKSKAVGRRKKMAASAETSPSGKPMVDTSFAAEAAARMLASRAKLGAKVERNSSEKESGTFKQLKEGVNKPSGQAAANVIGSALGPSRSNLPIPNKGQTAHSQSMGNVSRINVPRRTGG
jgi:hypothetical protein